MEGKIKITPDQLNSNFLDVVNPINFSLLNETFKHANPYPHVVIDNFLQEDFAEKLYQEFPAVNEKWHFYNNPLEVKYANDDIENMSDTIKNFFYFLNSEVFMKKLRDITGIENLDYDPYLHGAGLHAMPSNGRLHCHLDYEKHPFSGKERRINLIYFMNKDWDEKWGGNLELWDKDMQNKQATISPSFNRAVIFQTNDISWHGIPEVMTNPPDVMRKSIACYWVSDLDSKKDSYRLKAKFSKRPQDSDEYKKLYEIREYRRITDNDLKEL